MKYNILLIYENFPKPSNIYKFIIEDIHIDKIIQLHGKFLTYGMSEVGYITENLDWLIDFLKSQKIKALKYKAPSIIEGGEWVVIHTGISS